MNCYETMGIMFLTMILTVTTVYPDSILFALFFLLFLATTAADRRAMS